MAERNVSGIVHVKGVDDEYWPHSDEHISKVYNVPVTRLNEGQPAQNIDVPHTKWGDECRIEVDLRISYTGTGSVKAEGQCRLYEGTTENTSDLEDTKDFVFTVPKGGQPAHYNINLRNSEPGGGDTGSIKISLTNSIYEEPE